MPKSRPIKLAIDIGGTFTDTVLMRGGDIIASNKTPTTPDHPERGALQGARLAFQTAGIHPGDVSLFVHGTTLATNALIERRGARVATLSTHGFRDILAIGYERRYSQYDINIEKPEQLVPRSRSLTVKERMSFDGQVLSPLTDETAIKACEKLARMNVEAVAVCLLHSYANPVHELRIRELISEHLPNVAISLSSEVSPEAREFDRLSITVANAYIQPLISTYLNSLSQEFTETGLRCPILMMTAGGGMTSLENAAALPIRLLESGPAGGAILAARAARAISAEKVMSFDMGGTTAKLCLIDNYKPQSARRFEVSRAERFIKGSGMPVRIPVIEMIEIGAGGGSIAGVDPLGRIKVGPKSAGSEPGPAAFDKGGADPTVTDADYALGYLDATEFAEGKITLNSKANQNALWNGVANPLGVKIDEAAIGISEIVNENMASAARMHAVESGRDIGERMMISFGGNGPLHATRVARRAGIRSILIPPDPGVGSAVGFLYAPISFEIVRSRYTTLESFEAEAIDRFLKEMERDARSIVAGAAGKKNLSVRRTAFMRYQGQGHELEVELPAEITKRETVEQLRQAFEIEYERQFTRLVPSMTIEILNWGLFVSTDLEFDGKLTKNTQDRTAENIGHTTILCDLTEQPIQAAKYQRKDLFPGTVIKGPALICEPQTTTLVSTDFIAEVDNTFNLRLTRVDQPERPT